VPTIKPSPNPLLKKDDIPELELKMQEIGLEQIDEEKEPSPKLQKNPNSYVRDLKFPEDMEPADATVDRTAH